MLTVVETKRGKPCFIFNNYFYLRNRIRNTNIYWRCEKRGECPGRLTQKAGKEPVLTAAHNHDPDEKKKKKKMFTTNLKRRIREDPIPVRKLFRGELINRLKNELDSVCTLPQFYQIKSSLYRTNNATYSSLPKSVEEVSIEGNRLNITSYSGSYHVSYFR